MSMPIDVYSCNKCDLESWNTILWGAYTYVHPSGREYNLDRNLGWCNACSTLAPVETLQKNHSRLFINRQSSPRCLECGSEDASTVQLPFTHPGCGGTISQKEHPGGLRISMKFYDKFYDLEGRILPEEPTHHRKIGSIIQRTILRLSYLWFSVREYISIFGLIFLSPLLFAYHFLMCAASPSYRKKARKNAEKYIIISIEESSRKHGLRNELKMLNKNYKRRQQGLPEENYHSPNGFCFTVHPDKNQ
ncbi:MAG: hypothetical protein H7839_22785 [Magnetococcus sp. YQC-5]